MTTTELVPDHLLPDIRPRDVVRMRRGRMPYIVERVERVERFSFATMRPLEPLTASGKKRAREYKRTDNLVLLERPADSQPMTEIPWDTSDLDRQLRLLERTERRRREDERRLEARLGRLRAAGVQVEPRDAGAIEDGEALSRLTQWRKPGGVTTRFEYEAGVSADKLLRLVQSAENELDDLAAGVSSYAAWGTTSRGTPWRGVVWARNSFA